MVNTHEVDLDDVQFNYLRKNNHIILSLSNIEHEDYILFRQKDTTLFVMTQVNQIVHGYGLKDGYGLFVISKLG